MPIEGQMEFDDGDDYDGTFNEDGTFKEGNYMDYNPDTGNYRYMDGKWNEDGSFEGSVTGMNEEDVLETGRFIEKDGNYIRDPEELQEEKDTEQHIINRQIESNPPEKPNRLD